MSRIIHTTAGVRDFFGDEYERKSILMSKINSLFESYGYHNIQTPSIEFYPVFDKDKGTIHSSQLYKIIDKEGHTLVLRPDFTPSIARAVSMYFNDELFPIRLCYKGNVFLNNTNYRGRLNESTEMGVELINYDGPEADAELISLSVETMIASGIKDFQISIGNIGLFNALTAQAQIDDFVCDKLRHLLSIRNQFGAIELIDGLDIEEHLKAALMELPNLFGDVSILEKAKRLAFNPEAISSIERLRKVYDILKEYKCEKYISFDMGMISDFTYYTGILFQAITYGSGDAVIKGGRYNCFIEKFGKKAPAIGFTTLIDSLFNALQRQNILPLVPRDEILILYEEGAYKKAVSEAGSLRCEGKKVSCVQLDKSVPIQEYKNYAKRINCEKIIYIGIKDCK